jgi:hypothetical protein
MQQSLRKPISEEPQTSEPMTGKALLLWRLKRLFWGRNSITTALFLYGLIWWGLLWGIIYLLQVFHIYLESIYAFSLLFGIPSLLSAYITTKISPRQSILAIGIFSGGLTGLIYNEYIINDRLEMGNEKYVAFFILLTSNLCVFLLARKIRNKHFGIVKQKIK